MITESILLDSVGEEARDVMLVRQTTLQNIKHNLKVAQERMKSMLIEKGLRESFELELWPTSSSNHIGTMPWVFTKV
jgi:hypothetical protein